MHYYIDGYNLMFRLLPSHDDLSEVRQKLIEDLAAKASFLNLNLTIVFDAQYHPSEGSRSHYQNLEILFTDEGEIADERILEEIRQENNPSQVTVVTSDKKLAWFARRCRAATEPVEFFVTWLNKRFKNRVRHEKSAKEPSFKPKKKTPPKRCKPSQEVLPEKCTEYYLEAFHKRLEETEKKLPVKESEPKKRRKKIEFSEESQDIQDKGISDSERWLKIFEQKDKKPFV